MKRTPLKRTGFKKRPRKRIAKRRARYQPGFWAGQKRALLEEQDGWCAWCSYCGVPKRAWVLDAAHIEPLKMGGSRDDEKNQRNQLSNLVGLCRQDHRLFDAKDSEWRQMFGWMLKSLLATRLARDRAGSAPPTPRTP